MSTIYVYEEITKYMTLGVGYTPMNERTVFYEVWGMHDRGEIGFNTAHRMLGRYFGYSECCTDAFLAYYPHSDGKTGDTINDQFWCWDCLPIEGVAE